MLNLYLAGAVVPKARPRVTKNGTYLPERYRDWREETERNLLLQVSDRSLLPILKTTISIKLIGSHRGDLDNLAGAILDALVSAKILKDDRLSCVSKLIIEHEPNKKTKGAEIQLLRL